MGAPSSPIRRAPPRQARSRATRHRLLDATIACLVELGYAQTTTTEVCARAGVSQGALFRHFPSKSALLAATVEHLYAFLMEDFRRTFRALEGREDRVRAAVELLRDTFARPTLHAALELLVAGRTDETLAEALAPVLQTHRESLRYAAEELFPGASARPGFEATLDLMLYSLQGAAVGAQALPDPEGEELRLEALVALARPIFGEDV